MIPICGMITSERESSERYWSCGLVLRSDSTELHVPWRGMSSRSSPGSPPSSNRSMSRSSQASLLGSPGSSMPVMIRVRACPFAIISSLSSTSGPLASQFTMDSKPPDCQRRSMSPHFSRKVGTTKSMGLATMRTSGFRSRARQIWIMCTCPTDRRSWAWSGFMPRTQIRFLAIVSLCPPMHSASSTVRWAAPAGVGGSITLQA
mmetsp:Transcript_13398/g.39937  ORF Transcript_13398/g.39937 Transcript_13398/m.39937 type:complete len:204 (-) Transcript_13398:714-1325(-)